MVSVCFLIAGVLLSSPFADKVIRHRACSLKDTAHAIFAAELDPEFDRMCEEIKEARRKRGKHFILMVIGKKKPCRSKHPKLAALEKMSFF